MMRRGFPTGPVTTGKGVGCRHPIIITVNNLVSLPGALPRIGATTAVAGATNVAGPCHVRRSQVGHLSRRQIHCYADARGQL